MSPQDSKIFTNEFRLKKHLSIMADKKIDCPLWGGEIKNLNLRTLLVDLSEKNINIEEYGVAMRVGQNPIYILRLAFDDEDQGDFLIQENFSIKKASTLLQAWALVGVETFLESQNFGWKPLSNFDDLFEAVSKIIET